jgi:ribosomal protein S18
VAFRCFFRGRMENGKCLALIQLYKSKEVLWNSKSDNYHHKSIREDARKDMGDKIKMPVQDLKKKTTLLASYRREKWRIKKSHITGPCTKSG